MKKKIILSCLVVGMSLFGCSSSKTETGKKEVQTTKLTSYRDYQDEMDKIAKDAGRKIEDEGKDYIDSLDNSYKIYLEKEKDYDKWIKSMYSIIEDANGKIYDLSIGYMKLIIETEDLSDWSAVNGELYDCYQNAFDTLYDLYDDASQELFDVNDGIIEIISDAYFNDDIEYEEYEKSTDKIYNRMFDEDLYKAFDAYSEKIYVVKDAVSDAVYSYKEGDTLDIDKIVKEAEKKWTEDNKANEKKEESKKEETKKEETKKEESKPVETPTQSNTVNPDLKAFLDSYESFMDEYVDYMNKLSEDPTNTELMLGYADMLAKYADFTDKIDAYDESTMSDADLAYYLEVQSRVLNKLSNVQ